MNRCEVAGGLTRDAEESQGWLRFTLAVSASVYNPDTRSEELDQVFVSVEWRVPDVLRDDQMLYRGDKVYVVGQLTQGKGRDGKQHTRVRALVVTCTARGAAGRQALTPGGESWDTPPF